MYTRWANVVLGIWLVLAPQLLDYGESARMNDIFVGAAMAIAAILSMRKGGFRFVNAALGVWLIAAPFVLSYGEAHAVVSDAPVARWNDLLVGVAALVTSLVGTRTEPGRPSVATPR